MRKRKLIFAALLSCCSALVFADAMPAIVGEAFDLKTQKLLYREYHFLADKNQAQRVLYKDAEGNTIAEKQIQFNHYSQPDIEQQNALCGEYIEVKQNVGANRLAVAYRPKEDKKIKNKTIEKSAELVIDAGFNSYVVQHWEQLLSGDVIEFHYLVPSRLRSYAFTLGPTNCDSQQDTSCFLIKPDVWYLNLALDPIQLTYNNADKRLLRFSGLGNIADERCDYLAVDIHYWYGSEIMARNIPL